jgi:DNA-binding LacI/PurR family transcriptional regulator
MEASPGKKQTIEDVAREMGISIATVSRAFTGNGRISPLTREAVLETARRMGFQANPAAQRLATGRTDRLVPLFSLYLDLGSGTMKLQALQRGYDAPLHAYGNFDPYHPVAQTSLVENLTRHRPPAIICHASGFEQGTLNELRRYQNEGGIVITYDQPVDLDCDKVLYDWKDYYVKALRHLKELGHRDIGWYHPGPIGTVAQLDDTCRALDEPAGSDSWLPHFRDAMNECGLSLQPEWLWSGYGNEPGGAQLAERVLRLQKRPTALCIVNDRAAAGFIGAAWRAGLRVPQEVSVVGHDDLEMAAWFPIPITTVSSNIGTIAEQVVELTTSRIEGRYQGPPREVVVSGQLLHRDTTAPPAR